MLARDILVMTGEDEMGINNNGGPFGPPVQQRPQPLGY